MRRELFTQPANMDFDELGAGIKARSPHLRQQLGARDDTIRTVGQAHERAELAGGQVEGSADDPDAARTG